MNEKCPDCGSDDVRLLNGAPALDIPAPAFGCNNCRLVWSTMDGDTR
jgi:hypothetical protein